MIHLPKNIEATGYDCLIACTTMVCMYWRNQKPHLTWNLSNNFDNEEWNSFYDNGLKYVKSGGVPFNNITRYLNSLKLPLKANLEFLDSDIQLEKLIMFNVPPIVLYDHIFMLKGIKRTPYHAVVLIDKTEETFIAIDPNLSPKYQTRLHKTDFKEAWGITRNATVILTPHVYKVRRRKIPTVTLPKWMGSK